MARRGNCCRCLAGSCSTGLIFTGRRNALLSWLTQAVTPPNPLPDPDERGFPTRFLVLRPWLEWVSGTTRRPRGGSLLADLQANAISVGASVALFWDRPTSQVTRSFGIRYHQGVTFSETELTQPMYVSLFGGAAQAGAMLRLAPTNAASGLYFENNAVAVLASCIPSGSWLLYEGWQLSEYGNVLPTLTPYLETRPRRVAYAQYVRDLKAQQDNTQLFPRYAFSLGGATRLIQPQSTAAAQAGNSIEILTSIPEDGVIVATAKPQWPGGGLVQADISAPSLIWPESLWKPLFSRFPLFGLGGSAYRAAIYRDGEFVATVSRTPPPQPSNWTGPFAEHTDEDGSYLLQFDSNAGQLQGFLSFVIDQTPPMGCFEQVNDFFEGDPTNASGVSYAGNVGKVRRFTTEPTRTLASTGQEWRSYSSTRSEFSRDLEAGSHTLEYQGSFFDEVGNPMPTPLPTAQFQVHAIPTGQKFGAQATLSLPPNDDSLVYDSPVPSITVTFNRQVSGLQKAMFTVSGRKADGSTIDLPFTLSGQSGEIAGSTQGGGTTFTLTLDTDPEKQSYNTSWLVVFDPRSGGQVFADAGNQPPEPCLLRSRCSWLIRQDPAPVRTLIDTSSFGVGLSRIPTLTATLSESALPEIPARNDSLIDLSADVVLPVAAIPLDVPPMGCFEQVSDFFEGDPTNASGLAWNQEGFAEIARVESERTTPEPDGENTPPAWLGTSTVSRSLAASPEPYTIANQGTFRDDEGVAMPGPPTAQFRVHAIPPGQRFGSHAWISIEGSSAADKQILRGAVSFLTITFNRAIEGLTRSMISVVGTRDNGQTVEATFRLYQGSTSSLELVDDDEGVGTTFTLALEQPNQQVPNSRWLVTLTPGSTLKVPEIGDSPEEPCRLVARRAWLIQQTEVPFENSSQTAWYRYGSSSPFVPQVPPALDDATDVPYSYFGLSTTVYPSPPAALTCPAPGAAQPHSSLILGGGGITSLSVNVSGSQYFSSPRSFSASLGGEPCSQNVWVHSGGGGPSGGQHQTSHFWSEVAVAYIGGQLVYSQSSFPASALPGGLQFGPAGNVKAWASAIGFDWYVESTSGAVVARRAAATYAALQTSTLGQLTLTINMRANTRATSYSDFRGDNASVAKAPAVWRADQDGSHTVAVDAVAGARNTTNIGFSAPTDPALLALWSAWVNHPPPQGNKPEDVAAHTASVNAARQAYLSARTAYVQSVTINWFDRPWPPQFVQLTPDENGAISGGGGSTSIGVVLNTDGSVAGMFATTPSGQWVAIRATSGFGNAIQYAHILVRGQPTATSPDTEPVKYNTRGYQPFELAEPFEDEDGNMESGGWFELRPDKPGSATLPAASLTFTRQQEETLASGGSVQFTAGNLVYTISAS